MSGDQVPANQNLVLEVLIIRRNSHMTIAGEMLKQAVMIVIPRLNIIRDSMPVIIQKHFVEIVAVARPQPLPVAGIENVEVGGKSYQKSWSLL